MKAIITASFILFMVMTVQAQKSKINHKIYTVEKVEVALTFKNNKREATTEIARLYKFKNSKIKKALSFRTKRNKTKIV